MLFRLLKVLFITLSLFSCSKNEPIYQPTEKVDPYVIYKEAYTAFEKNDFLDLSSPLSIFFSL